MKKHNFIFDLFNWILLALPLIFVIGTLVYTQSNENAKESYYGDTINEYETTFIQSNSDFILGKTYYYLGDTTVGQVDNALGSSIPMYTFSDLEYGNNFYDSVSVSYYVNTNSHRAYIYLKDLISNTMIVSSGDNINFSFKGTLVSYNSTYDFSTQFYYLTYNEYSFLNNALPYAMDQFNQIGFNKIDFVHFFTDLFIDASSINNVYVTFINSYMNYILFTELAVFIPSVFLWIIHLFKHLGMDFMGRKEN